MIIDGQLKSFVYKLLISYLVIYIQRSNWVRFIVSITQDIPDVCHVKTVIFNI